MDKFFIGQLVKIVPWAEANPGLQGIIASKSYITRQGEKAYKVDWIDGVHMASREVALIPVDDGGKKSSWEESEWKPKDKVLEALKP